MKKQCEKRACMGISFFRNFWFFSVILEIFKSNIVLKNQKNLIVLDID